MKLYTYLMLLATLWCHQSIVTGAKNFNTLQTLTLAAHHSEPLFPCMRTITNSSPCYIPGGTGDYNIPQGSCTTYILQGNRTGNINVSPKAGTGTSIVINLAGHELDGSMIITDDPGSLTEIEITSISSNRGLISGDIKNTSATVSQGLITIENIQLKGGINFTVSGEPVGISGNQLLILGSQIENLSFTATEPSLLQSNIIRIFDSSIQEVTLENKGALATIFFNELYLSEAAKIDTINLTVTSDSSSTRNTTAACSGNKIIMQKGSTVNTIHGESQCHANTNGYIATAICSNNNVTCNDAGTNIGSTVEFAASILESTEALNEAQCLSNEVTCQQGAAIHTINIHADGAPAIQDNTLSKVSENQVVFNNTIGGGDIVIASNGKQYQYNTSNCDNNSITAKASKIGAASISSFVNSSSNTANSINIEEGSQVQGALSVKNISSGDTLTQSIPTYTLDNAVLTGNISIDTPYVMNILIQHGSSITGDITRGSASTGDTVLTIKDSCLFGCYNLGQGNNQITIENSRAYPCSTPAAQKTPFVEMGCCTNNHLQNIVFYGNGNNVYACDVEATGVQIVAPPYHFLDQAFYWISNTKVLAAFGIEVANPTTEIPLRFVVFDTMHPEQFKSVGSEFLQPSAHRSTAPLYYSSLAWHVERIGEQWDINQQYLAICEMFPTLFPGPLIAVFKVDTGNEEGNVSDPIKLQQVLNAGWLTPFIDDVTYLTWQPTLSFDFPLTIIGINRAANAIVAIPVKLPDQPITNAVTPTFVTTDGLGLPVYAKIFATPDFLYMTGLYGGVQQLRRYRVTVPNAAQVTLTEDEFARIDIPIGQYGLSTKIRCCNDFGSNIIFLSCVLCGGTPTYLQVDVNQKQITRYDFAFPDAIVYTDIAPQCPSPYNIAGLISDAQGNDTVYRFSCDGITGCAPTQVYPTPTSTQINTGNKLVSTNALLHA